MNYLNQLNHITTRQIINVLVVLFLLYIFKNEISKFFCKNDYKLQQPRLILKRLPPKINMFHLDTDEDDFNTTMTDIMNPNRNIKYRLGY